MSPSNSVHVVGIAGPSGSGKTLLAQRLAERIPGGAVVFALDSYYRDQRGVPEESINVDVPEAIDSHLAIQHVRTLAEGLSIQQPIYDYARHARAPVTRTLNPAPYVLVEGLFALYWPDMRSAIDTAVFLALDHDECLKRRIARDLKERARSRTAIVYQYQQTVRPMYERYVHATQRHAELVLDASQPIDTLLERVLARILLT